MYQLSEFPYPPAITRAVLHDAGPYQIEIAQAQFVAAQIAPRLPQNEREAARLIEEGYTTSQKMSWQVVAQEYLLPGLERASTRHSRV